MFFRSLVILLSLAAGAQPAFANEEAAGPAVEKEYSGKQNQDWEKIQTKLTALKAKINSQDQQVKTLAAEKAHLTDERLLQAKVEELKKEYSKLEQLTNEYNQLNDEYLTKFPERGVKENRVYTRYGTKSLESYEEDNSLQGRVNRVQKKVLSQYPAAVKPKKARPAQGASAEPTEKAGGSKDITDPIIFQK